MVTSQINIESTRIGGILQTTTAKQRRKANAALCRKRELSKQKTEAAAKKKEDNFNSVISIARVKRKRRERQSFKKLGKNPVKNFIDAMNEKLDGPSFVHLSITDSIPNISTGLVLVTLATKPNEGFLNNSGDISDVTLITCSSYMRCSLENGDKLVALREASDNLPLITLNKDDILVSNLNSASFPIQAIFQRRAPPILHQGFARCTNTKEVLTTPTKVHIDYIKKLFDLPEKLQGLAMRARMKEDFPHPRDVLTVEQIESQISKFTREKKNQVDIIN